ncbi:MAG: Gfo/Idh/MocA family oxidoreductase, partial [Candidatus Omnitrophica bacterium]|nr:Gfo/Idh/MocA family oxidoreductase [Candidatus Omnitrophota bacterium]
RKKGKVIIVGDVGLNLKRGDFYKKELDLLISTSYGPGRYDERYEKAGHDYPYPYVRWTENRNMEEYLRLLSEKRIDIKSLVEKIYPVSIASDAYDELRAGTPKPLVTLLEYSKESVPENRIQISNKRALKNILNVGLIGAGSFAKGTILPNIDRLKNMYNICAIASKTGANAKAVAKRYRANYATTDYREVLSDNNIDMVIISTRHDLHARIAIEAARAGKGIFLEKPMALHEKELGELAAVLNDTKVPFTVGFNRRFSPYIKMVKDCVTKRTNPMMINYQMNASHVSKDHWIFSGEGGGRNIGEACHIYDIFNFLTGSEVSQITSASLSPKTQQYSSNDNFAATIKYADGSICNLIYTALGSKGYQKEGMAVYFDGKVIRMDDYKKMEGYGGCDCSMETERQEKGYEEEFAAFAASIKKGEAYSIPIRQLIQATEMSFAVEAVEKDHNKI